MLSEDELDESVSDDQLRGLIGRDEELIMWLTAEGFHGDGIDADLEAETN